MKSACRKALLLALLPFALASCVKSSTEIGKDLIDKSLLYDTYTVEFPIEDIRLRRADDLSGFSDTRLAIGAIRDETFGLTTRATAFCLVPALDTLDLGTDPEFVRFLVHFEADTISVAHEGQEHILQNLYVYSLTDTLSSKKSGTNRIIPHSTEIVTRGIPVYDVLKRLGPVLASRDEIATIDKYREYIQEVPGIYIESDIPEGFGGRINLFELSCLSVSNNYYYRNDNVGMLTVRSTYKGVRKDTTFLFIPGEPTLYDESEYLESNKQFYQYAFNRTSHEAPEGPATDEIRIEGGGGLKPVIPAAQLREKVVAAIVARGGDPSKTVVNKASLILPYESPGDETLVDLFPSIISPTIRKKSSDGTVTFAGLTDASASSENQGNLDRANRVYSLTDTLSSKKSGTNRIIPHSTEIVTRGIPVYERQRQRRAGSLLPADDVRDVLQQPVRRRLRRVRRLRIRRLWLRLRRLRRLRRLFQLLQHDDDVQPAQPDEPDHLQHHAGTGQGPLLPRHPQRPRGHGHEPLFVPAPPPRRQADPDLPGHLLRPEGMIETVPLSF